MTTRDVPIWLLVVVVASLVVSGCLGPGSQTSEARSEPPSGAVAAAAFADIDSLNVTTRFHYDRSSGNETIVRQYVIEPEGNRLWIKTLAPESEAGDLQVSNGSVMWQYDASNDEVVVREYDGTNRSLFVTGKRRYIFDRLNETSEVTESPSSVGVSPLPVVPAGGRADENLSFSNVSLEYGGVETVAGRRAHVVHMAANESRTGLRNQTVWYDTETFYQLRVETVFVSETGVTRQVQAVTQASFGEEVADERFVFDPPPDALVRRVGAVSVRTYSSLDTLASRVRMSIPDPELPGTFTFTEGRAVVRNHDGRQDNITSLIYTRQFNSVVVVKSNRTAPFEAMTTNASVEGLTVGDHEAYYREQPRILLWRCDGYLYRVAGLLSRERLVGIGESIACE